MPKEQGYDHLIKLLIVGDSGVGKTNMLLRFCSDNFLTSHLTTIGIDFKTKTIELEGKKIRMQIWDTAGQQRFKTITQTYYRGSMGILLTYSVSDIISFQNVSAWYKQIRTHATPETIVILVGNKSDAVRQVSYEQGSKLADQFGISFFEVSAKLNKGIQECFLTLGRQVKNRFCLENQISILSFTGSKLQKPAQKEKGKCC